MVWCTSGICRYSFRKYPLSSGSGSRNSDVLNVQQSLSREPRKRGGIFFPQRTSFEFTPGAERAGLGTGLLANSQTEGIRSKFWRFAQKFPGQQHERKSTRLNSSHEWISR